MTYLLEMTAEERMALTAFLAEFTDKDDPPRYLGNPHLDAVYDKLPRVRRGVSTTVWIIRYWMPPERFLTYYGVYTTRWRAARAAWQFLGTMHRDGWTARVEPITRHYPEARIGEVGFVIRPVAGDRAPRAFTLVTEEPVDLVVNLGGN